MTYHPPGLGVFHHRTWPLQVLKYGDLTLVSNSKAPQIGPSWKAYGVWVDFTYYQLSCLASSHQHSPHTTYLCLYLPHT